MKMTFPFFTGQHFGRGMLSVSAAAMIGASGHKAAQYAQSAWGDEGLVLVAAGAVAAFYALHTTFDGKARRLVRVLAAAAALALGLLEGGAIMQGGIEKATQQAQTTYDSAVSKWAGQKAAIDAQYITAMTDWKAAKARAEADQGNAKAALREELAALKAALEENTKSQRLTKASNKMGDTTPAYQALLDQQATLLARSQSITAELGKPLVFDDEPTKPVYPAEPSKQAVSLTVVEYAQAFAFPALVVILMFLRGRRDGEDAALLELADIQRQSDTITAQLADTLHNAEQRMATLLSGIVGQGGAVIQQVKQVADAELATLGQQLMQLQQTAQEVVRNADVAARAISQRTANETHDTLTASLHGLLADAKTAKADLQDAIVTCNAAIAGANKAFVGVNESANKPFAPANGTANAIDQKKKELTHDEALFLLENQVIPTSEEGNVTIEQVMLATGLGRPRAIKLMEAAWQSGYLGRKAAGRGWTYFYPKSRELSLNSNVVQLNTRTA